MVRSDVHPLILRGRVALGCMGLTGLFGPVEHDQAVETIHRALDLGIRHFDTAELYGPYRNEELLAAALDGIAEDVYVATKVGYRLVDGKMAGLDSRPTSLRQSVDGSLRRLRRDRIDLVYQHRQDPTVPVEDAIGSLEDLRIAGKIGAIGLSAVDPTTVARASKVAHIAAVQNQFSILHRYPAVADILASDEARAFVAFSPLARGLLSPGARERRSLDLSDYRRADDRFADQQFDAMKRRLAPMFEIARSRDVSAATVALAWILAQDDRLIVIPGARSPRHVDEVIAAATLCLSADELRALDALSEVASR